MNKKRTKKKSTTLSSNSSKSRSNVFTKWFGSIKTNVRDPFPKKVGFAVAGAAMYPIIPWALKAWFKMDMDGFKAPIVGAFIPTVVGLAINKPEMALAGIGCATTHLIYGLGTGTLQNTFGTPPPRFDKTQTNALADLPALPVYPRTVPEGYKEIVMPNGEIHVVATAVRPIRTLPEPSPVALNDFRETPLTPSKQLNDFIESPIVSKPSGMSDFVDSPTGKTQASMAPAIVSQLADENTGLGMRNFQQAVSRGKFGRR